MRRALVAIRSRLYLTCVGLVIVCPRAVPCRLGREPPDATADPTGHRGARGPGRPPRAEIPEILGRGRRGQLKSYGFIHPVTIYRNHIPIALLIV